MIKLEILKKLKNSVKRNLPEALQKPSLIGSQSLFLRSEMSGAILEQGQKIKGRSPLADFKNAIFTKKSQPPKAELSPVRISELRELMKNPQLESALKAIETGKSEVFKSEDHNEIFKASVDFSDAQRVLRKMGIHRQSST